MLNSFELRISPFCLYVGRSEWYNFLKGWKVSLTCSYRSTFLFVMLIDYVICLLFVMLIDYDCICVYLSVYLCCVFSTYGSPWSPAPLEHFPKHPVAKYTIIQNKLYFLMKATFSLSTHFRLALIWIYKAVCYKGLHFSGVE